MSWLCLIFLVLLSQMDKRLLTFNKDFVTCSVGGHEYCEAQLQEAAETFGAKDYPKQHNVVHVGRLNYGLSIESME